MPCNIFPIRNRATACTVLVLLIAIDIVEGTLPLTCPIPPQLINKLHADSSVIETAATDFGNVVHFPPSAVLYPSTVQDIQILIASSFRCPLPFAVSAKGHGHSLEGQAMAPKGVVVDMQEYKRIRNGSGVLVSADLSYADVGGDLLWIDVLNETLEKGAIPAISWTGYLELTVGGTLSNAGIGGESFRLGPQVSNVYELDVITGKGEMVTCSASNNPELFDAVLGGLGQFGIITRARIPLQPAKPRARWLRAIYSDFEQFIRDHDIISQSDVVDNLGNYFLLDNGTPNSWATSFFPPEDLPKILSLVKEFGVIYCLEIVDPYDESTEPLAAKRLENFLLELSPIPELVHQKDVAYYDFLNRGSRLQVLKNESHPWLCLFVPKSRMSDFNLGVIKDILLKGNITFGATGLYLFNKNKFDEQMSVVIPDEDVFYGVMLLHTSSVENWKPYYDQNNAIKEFCDNNDIKFKTHFHTYSRKDDWINHFGPKWDTFLRRKQKFDPKHILSTGQKIFN